MYTFTIVDNVKSRRVLTHVTPIQFAEVIRSGGGIHQVPDYRHIIKIIRNEPDSAKQKQYKLHLPAAFVSCHYTTQTAKKGAHYRYVPYMQLDFDVSDNEALQCPVRLQENIAYFNQQGLCIFESPRGGLKLVVPLTTAQQQHNQAYTALTQYIEQATGLVGDPYCTGETRALFLSHDPQCQWSTTSTPLDPFRYYTPPTKPAATSLVQWEEVASSADTSSWQAVFDRVRQCLARQAISWERGKRNTFLLHISECARAGMGLAELVELTHRHIAGRYDDEFTKEQVTKELQRFYVNYHGRALRQIKNLYKAEVTQFDCYLSEHAATVWHKLQQVGTLYLDAPTGSGKTRLVAELARLANCRLDLLMPTTALATQQQNATLGIAAATGTASLTKDQSRAPVLATCYESIAKAQQRQAEILVIDEAHELAAAYAYRAKAVQTIQQHLSGYRYVVYLSGSMFPVLALAKPEQVLRFQPQQVKRVPYQLIKLGKMRDTDYFLSALTAGVRHVFYKNNKEDLLALKQVLEERGYRVALVMADTKQDAGYQGIVADSSLTDHDILLTTCLLQAGINILDDIPVTITFGTNCTLVDYIQFAARFRHVTPQVRICHTGMLTMLHSFNGESARQFLRSQVREYAEAEEANRQRGFGEYSFTSLLTKPDGILYRDGAYQPDEYYVLHHQYLCANQNALGNTEALKHYLHQHHFDYEGQHEAGIFHDEQLRAAKKERKQERALQTAAAVSALLRGTLVPHTKLEKELRDRYTRLVQLVGWEAVEANTNLLSNKTTYELCCNRMAFLHCVEAQRRGQALSPRTQVYFDKLRALADQFEPDSIVPVDQVQKKVHQLFGRTGNSAMLDTMSILFDLKRTRLRQQGERVYVYEIGKRHELPAQHPAVATNELDWFFE